MLFSGFFNIFTILFQWNKNDLFHNKNFKIKIKQFRLKLHYYDCNNNNELYNNNNFVIIIIMNFISIYLGNEYKKWQEIKFNDVLYILRKLFNLKVTIKKL